MIASEVIAATRRNTEKLIKWFVQYGAMDKFVVIHGIDGFADLAVSFHRPEHEWSLATFGRDGWTAKRDGGHLSYTKQVDGVPVILYHFGLEAPDADQPVTLSMEAATFAPV